MEYEIIQFLYFVFDAKGTLIIFKWPSKVSNLDFSFEQKYKDGEVASLRNYLMKYMEKTFIETMPDWSPEELVFNAVAWHEGYRLFGCSRNLSKVMSRKTVK